TAGLRARLETAPLLVVARAGRRGDPVAHLAGASVATRHGEGGRLQWHGPGDSISWDVSTASATMLRTDVAGVETWATLDGASCIAARRVGSGTVATLGFHPSALRDIDGSGTALLRVLLARGSQGPTA